MIAAILNFANLNSTILDSTILVFPLKLTHTCQDWFPPFAQKILHSFILTHLDDGSHLEFYHLGFSHLSFYSQTHSHFPRLVPTICPKKLHSFILTQLDDGSHLEFCHCGFRHLVISLSDLLKNTLSPLWLWLKLIQSDSNSFILTQLDGGSNLEFC